MDISTVQAPHLLPGAAGNFRSSKAFYFVLTSHPVLVRTDDTTVGSYINRQGETRPTPLLKLSHSLLMWSSVHCLSCQATHIQGQQNIGTDLLSRRGATCEKAEVAPSSGDSDMGLFWHGGDGPLCIQREHPLLPVVFRDGPWGTIGVGCTGASIAHHFSVCIFSSGNYSACTGECVSAGSDLDLCSSLMASKVVVHGDNQSAGCGTMVASSLLRPPVSSRGMWFITTQSCGSRMLTC